MMMIHIRIDNHTCTHHVPDYTQIQYMHVNEYFDGYRLIVHRKQTNYERTAITTQK